MSHPIGRDWGPEDGEWSEGPTVERKAAMTVSLGSKEYWLRWAYNRGWLYREDPCAHDTAWSVAACVSSDPAEQAEAARGWADCDAAIRAQGN